MKNRFLSLFLFSALLISCTQQQESTNPIKGVWKMVGGIKYENNKPLDTLSWDDFGLSNKKYLVMTLHRPSNVDEEEQLKALITQIATLGEDFSIIL